MGYGRMGTQLAKALAERGTDVYDSLGEGPPQFHIPDDVHSSLAQKFGVDTNFERDSKVKRTNTVCWAAVPGHASWWYEGQSPNILTMWEARRLPEQFRERLHAFDTVIVPSQHNVELFSEYHDNVQLMLLGIDPKTWHYTPRSIPTHTFNFLIGGSGVRKGTDLAYKAFMRVFGDWKGDGPEPRLVMKNPRGEQFGGPRIDMITGRLSAEQEVALYEQAHCYLQPSRGEGFGLQPLQAIAQGCPTILTNAHGHASFADLGLPIDAGESEAAYFIYGDAGQWWEPDFDQLCERMRDVYDSYEEHVLLAHMAAGVAGWQFSWDRSAQRFETILGDRLTVPYSGDGTWTIPDIKLYAIITNKDWVCDIGGTVYHFQQGVPVHGPADVKRVLFEANLLDPACMAGDDTGLLPQQLEQADKDNAAGRPCPTCNMVPGRTKGDELFTLLEALDPWQQLAWRARDLLEAEMLDDGAATRWVDDLEKIESSV